MSRVAEIDRELAVCAGGSPAWELLMRERNSLVLGMWEAQGWPVTPLHLMREGTP